jgi:hypothetical protein
MTKREAAIISAYTGIMCGEFREMHKFVEELLGRLISTHEFANHEFCEKIKELSRPYFMELCENLTEDAENDGDKETDVVMLTKRDLAILAAYTGYSYIGGMDNMCCFIEDLFGREVSTLDLCDKKMQKEVHERVRPLFMELCERLKKEVEN